MALALRADGFTAPIHLVGGAVRDHLLQLPPQNDFDLVVEEDAAALAQRVFDLGLADHPPAIYPRFGTAMVSVDGLKIEFVTARKESYDADSRKPHVEPASFLEDALRRDFTVNALAMDLDSGEVIDLLGTGLEDLKAGILRTPLDPHVTFQDDPLRMLRAVRFRWRLGFEYAPGLAETIRESSHRLSVISQERITEELTKILLGRNPHRALEELRILGLLNGWADELVAMVGVEQGKWHHLDVWGHTLEVVNHARGGSLTLMLAALLHDIAKPRTRSIDEAGQTRFFSHENIGAEMAHEMCVRWRFSQETARDVALLVKNHMRLCSAPELSDSAARRIIRDLGPLLETWLDLIDCDAKGLKAGVRTLDIEKVRAQLRKVEQATPAKMLESPLTGRQIMSILGVESGEMVGQAKAFLTEHVLTGELIPGDEAKATDVLKEWARNRENS